MGRLSEVEQRIIEALWHEFVVTHQVSSGNGECWLGMIVSGDSFRSGPPYWFVAYELGLKIGHGPNVFDVMLTLAEDNEARQHHFKGAEAKRERADRELVLDGPRATAPARRDKRAREELQKRRLTPEGRRRRKRNVAKRAGLCVRQGQVTRVEE